MKLPSLLQNAVAALFFSGWAAPSASAQSLPISYTLQLQVRADLGGSAFNLPNGSTFNSVTATLNDAGKVAVKASTVGLTTSPGLWFGGQGAGVLVYNANDDEAFLSDPFINNSNQVSFPRFGSTSFADDGLYVYDNATGVEQSIAESADKWEGAAHLSDSERRSTYWSIADGETAAQTAGRQC